MQILLKIGHALFDCFVQCLWRMVRMMPNIIETLKVDRVLLDLHQFLKAFPSHSWRDRPSDTPLRTIKTILHSMAKILGEKVGGCHQFLVIDRLVSSAHCGI